MCGIVGVIHKRTNGFNQNEIDAFTQLLFADQVRGSHGTGIFFNTKQGKPSIKTLRAPIPSSSFISRKEYQEINPTLFKESNFIVGHNRSATKGKIDAACTHPFREGHITLVHNGTLLTQKSLNKDVEVDSHAICHSIAERGAKETLKMVDGAFALVWFDSKEKTLNLCRNSQRPLYIIEYNTCFILVSELELGLWIGQRNNFIFKSSSIVEPKKLYKFSLDDMTKYQKEDVDYFEYQHNVFPQSIWKGGKYKAKLAFGQKVRFRTGNITGPDNRACVEGDILKFQYLADGVVPVPTDFEDEFRINVYGTRKELACISNKNNLVGIVLSTKYKGDEEIYTVGNVEEYSKESKVVPITKHKQIGFTPRPEHQTKECAWCMSDKDVVHMLDGEMVCGDCFKWAPSAGAYN